MLKEYSVSLKKGLTAFLVIAKTRLRLAFTKNLYAILLLLSRYFIQKKTSGILAPRAS
jgi:hypothetical protein